MPAVSPAPSAINRFLLRWASARGWSGVAKTALEQVIVSSSHRR